MEELGETDSQGAILDMGCGPGGYLASRPCDGRQWVGLDIAMRWLILARKRLDELGRDDVSLICGCAESVPFRDEAFAAIVAGDVMEHVRSVDLVLNEAHRILMPGGS